MYVFHGHKIICHMSDNVDLNDMCFKILLLMIIFCVSHLNNISVPIFFFVLPPSAVSPMKIVLFIEDFNVKSVLAFATCLILQSNASLDF